MTLDQLITHLSDLKARGVKPDAKVFVSRGPDDDAIKEVAVGDVRRGSWFEVVDHDGNVHTGEVVVIQTWG